MTDILVPLGLFGMITAIVIFKASRIHRERMELIKQGINPVQFNPHLIGHRTLLVGMFCIAIGSAILISNLMGHGPFEQNTLAIGLMFLFGGVSLLVYWKLTAGDRERALRAYERHLGEEQSQNQTLNTGTAETGEVASPGAEK